MNWRKLIVLAAELVPIFVIDLSGLLFLFRMLTELSEKVAY